MTTSHTTARIQKLRQLGERIRSELGHTTALNRAHDELIALQEQYADATDKSARSAIRERIAALIEAEADHLEASKLARATSLLSCPDELRARAAELREVDQ